MNPLASINRIFALLLRYLYLLRSSWPRIIEIAYWPTMQMIIWGFVSQHFATASPELTAGGILISAVLVWDSLFRSHISYTLSFLEEMWSRNLGNLFVSPLRPWELIATLASISMMRTLIGMVPLLFLPSLFSVFPFSTWACPFSLFSESRPHRVGDFAICNGNLIRFGLGAESLTWVLPFLIAPFSCIYYPLATLPEWMQSVATFIPTSYVFEGMRALLIPEAGAPEGVFRADLLLHAFGLNAIYFIIGVLVFFRSFDAARKHGLLLQSGE